MIPAELEELLNAILTTQEGILDRLDLLDGGGPDSSAAPPEQALPEWVEWLMETYALALVIPNDWADSAAITAELTALRKAHTAAHSPKAGPWDALTWHDHLARMLDRIDPSHTHGYTQRRRDRMLGD